MGHSMVLFLLCKESWAGNTGTFQSWPQLAAVPTNQTK